MDTLQITILIGWAACAFVTFRMSISSKSWDIGEAIFLAAFFPLLGPAAYLIWLLRAR